MSASLISSERIKQAKQTYFNPIRHLQPQKLARMIDNFRAGYLREFAILMDVIERRDDLIANVASKRKKAVSRLDWQILTVPNLAEDQKEEAEAQRKALRFFYNNLTVRSATDLNVQGGFPLLVRQMMDSLGKGYAVHEIVWEPSEGNLRACFNFVPLWFFENTTGRLRFLQEDYAISGIPLDEGSWMVTVGDCLMEPCAIAYTFKRFPMQAWLHYCDKHGTPGIQGKTDAESGSERWEAMKEAVESISNNFACVTSLSDAIEKIDLSTAGELPYPSLIERMDRAIASLWRGADLSTLSATSGSGQGASLQGKEEHILLTDDAALISETLQTYVDTQVLAWHFGIGTKPLVYIELIIPAEKDAETEMAIDTMLIESDVPVSSRDLLERYGRSMPSKGAQVAKRPLSPATMLANEKDQSSSSAFLGSLAEWLGVSVVALSPLAAIASKLFEADDSRKALASFRDAAFAALPELISPDLDLEDLQGLIAVPGR